MLKYLLIAVVVIWLFYSPALRQQFKRTVGNNRKPPEPSKHQPQVMLTCAHCGVHFPQSDAIEVTQGGRTQHFCCPDHMRAGPRQA